MAKPATWLALGVATGGVQGAAAAASTVTVDVGATPLHAISPVLYSAFLETEINFGGEGGLYAELLFNRDFEVLGRGTIPTGSSASPAPIAKTSQAEPLAIADDFRPWQAVGAAVLSIDASTAPFKTNPHSLRVDAPAGAGVSNPGYWGIGVPRHNAGFNISLYARAAPQLSARLTVGDKVLAEVPLTTVAATEPLAHGWQQLAGFLQPPEAAQDVSAVLEIVVGGTGEKSTFWLDGVSLRPADAVDGLFRRDIFELMKGMQPGFMRTPGGNYLEGNDFDTRWQWKQTVGPAAARPGHFNSAWGYWVTDGLGVYELLRLAELLDTEAQMSVYTGYSMGQAYVPLSESQVFADDALDMVEFANGAPSTKWGSVRAAMGHPAPFGLKRLEVGNEERDMENYSSHYKLITSQLWAKHPELTIVASGRWGPNIDQSPCLTGQRCDVWDDHYYRTPDEMAAMAREYDSYNRSLPKVFVGEYAANRDKRGTLRAGVAEAAFLIGLERNSDAVVASSFAPLLNHLSASGESTQWFYNLINFNNTQLYALPSYYSQVMLSSALGKHALACDLQGGETPAGQPVAWIAAASVDASGRKVAIKLANYAAESREVVVSLKRWAPRQPTMVEASVLTASDETAENTLDKPKAVVPGPLQPAAALRPDGVALTLPPWSVAVATVTMGGHRGEGAPSASLVV